MRSRRRREPEDGIPHDPVENSPRPPTGISRRWGVGSCGILFPYGTSPQHPGVPSRQTERFPARTLLATLVEEPPVLEIYLEEHADEDHD